MIKNRTMISILAQPDISAIRTAQLIGQDHTVIPCICLSEGVLWPANAPHPELALAEEFGRFPDGWNGRPIVMNHPKVDDEPVAANSPSVLEDNAFGQMFNTKLVDKKLHTEIWINDQRVKDLGAEVADTVERLTSGDEVVEVSTGLFTMQEMTEGEHEGEHFDSIWRNIVPDHLAILPEGIIGACSVEDGCGAPRVNAAGEPDKEGEHSMTPTMSAVRLCEIADEEPIVMDPESEEGQQGIFQRAMQIGKNLFNFRDNTDNLSDSDLRVALHAQLSKTEDCWFWILTVFQNGKGGRVIYETGCDGSLFSQDFTIKGTDEEVTLSGERIEVRPVTKFVPVENEAGAESDNVQQRSQQENLMKTKEERVQALIANEKTQYSEADTEWLLGLEEEQLDKMEPVAEEVADEVIDETPAGEEEETGEEHTVEKYIADAPAEIQEVLNQGVQLHRGRKDAVIKALVGNSKNTFTKKQLEAKGIEELESLATLAGSDVTYELNSASLTDSADGDESFTPAPDVLDLSKRVDVAAS